MSSNPPREFDRLLSIPDVFSPEVPNENSPV